MMNNITTLDTYKYKDIPWPAEGISFISGTPEKGRKWDNINITTLPVFFGQILLKINEDETTVRIKIKLNNTSSGCKVNIEIINVGDEIIEMYAQPSNLFLTYIDALIETYNQNNTHYPSIELVIQKEGYYWEDVPRSF